MSGIISTVTSTAPDRTEAGEYFFGYINQVPAGDVLAILEAQLPETLALLQDISDERSLHRYAPGKWSIREVAGHLSDCERLFTFRAFWFARGLGEPLPSFDQEVAASHAVAHDRSWGSLIDEFRAVRLSSLALFRSLPPDAWLRRGVASGNPFTVRALAYVTAGHVVHHSRILRERYL
jgi:hypothetical protein